MNRRTFLVGAASGVAAFSGITGAQTPAAPPAGGQAPAAAGAAPARQGGAGGRGQVPANVPAHKLARISLMTLQFGMYIVPNRGTPTPEQTLTVLDLPKMYVDMYGVHNIEYQLGDIRTKSETDPNFIKELKAKLDENKVTMSQINMEIGAPLGMTADEAGRRQGIDLLKKWTDIANQYGCKRLMLNQNQGALTRDKKAQAVAYLKEIAAFGKANGGVMFSVETRGAAQTPELAANLGVKPWEFMIEIVEEAGANSNVDIGNVGAMNQQELHDCIKRWYPTTSGNMHIKGSPYWDIGTAVRYTESLGYKGLYSLEINNAGHGAVRLAYNTILANLA
jgi:sugar phosphate isomerase/epimerase